MKLRRPGGTPFSHNGSDANCTQIPLKPGGLHIHLCDVNKREYILLKANKMLLGAVEAQMGAVMDAFYSLIPRDLVER
jgi:HECT-domain (ubiquitin-transferase)